MARYEIFADPNGVGFLLDVQADLLDELDTRVIVPLLPETPKRKPVRRLNPTFLIEGKSYVMYSQLLVALPKRMLTARRGNLSRHHDEIVAALDMVFQGF